MKTILLLFLSALSCFGQYQFQSGVIGNGQMIAPVAAGGCPASPNVSETVNNDYVAFGIPTDIYYGGEMWTNTGATKQICRVDFLLASVDDTSARVLRCSIFATNAPNTLGDELGFKTVTGVNNVAYDWVTFTFSTPVTVTNGAYGIVLSDGTAEGTPNFRIGHNNVTGTLVDGWSGQWTSAKASYGAYMSSDVCIKIYWQ